MGSDAVAPDPFARFESEHEEALRALNRLESAADALERGERPAPYLETVHEVHTFLTTAVRQHNDNEERALFGLLDEEAPVALFVKSTARCGTSRTSWDRRSAGRVRPQTCRRLPAR